MNPFEDIAREAAEKAQQRAAKDGRGKPNGHAEAAPLPSWDLAAEDAEGLAANVLAWHGAHGLEDGDVAVAPADGLTLASADAADRLAATAHLAFPGRLYVGSVLIR
jgi:hypothetical protein